MKIRGLLSRLKNLLTPASLSSGGGWWPMIREPFAGAWQRNLECTAETAIAFAPAFACITRIASDIGKMRFMLMQGKDGIYTEVAANSPFWPVLRKPNHYQTHIEFKETWIISKLRAGNTFVLKQRDNRGVVTALYVLDPLRVQPLIATDGSIFYRLSADLISGIEEASVVVPASEIIHDRMNCLFHPLVGISPLFACALSAGLGLEIEKNSARFFMNGAKISGIITAPGNIGDDAAKKVTDDFNRGYTGANAGKVAVLGDGLKFNPLTMTSTDAQLIEQLKLSALQVCTAFHVPPHKIGVGQMPSYDNIEALNQQYYSECLQSPIEKMEQLLEEGIGLKDPFDICLDIDCLLRMDQKTLMESLEKGKNIMTPNEQRKKLGLPPVTGGDTVLRQQQDFSLEALAKRDALPDPFVLDKPTSNPTPSAAGPAATADPGEKQITDAEIDEAMSLVFKSVAPLKFKEAA